MSGLFFSEFNKIQWIDLQKSANVNVASVHSKESQGTAYLNLNGLAFRLKFKMIVGERGIQEPLHRQNSLCFNTI